MYICEAMINNTSLKSLNLSTNKITNEGFEIFLQSILENKTLNSINLEYN